MKNAFLIFSVLPLFLYSQESKLELEEQLNLTTVQIITYDSKKKLSSSGSGFFCELTSSEGIKKNLIVTNKHVVKDQDKGLFIFHRKLGNKIYGQRATFTLNNFESYWLFHPDSLVDLAVLDLDFIISQFTAKGIDLTTYSIPESLFVNDSTFNTLSILEDVVMIGYPIGLIDTFNHTPIARTGVTASQPKLDYLGTKEFLIDIAAFPGSSGSPVFLKTTRTGFKNNVNALAIGVQHDYSLIGILYAGPMYSPQTNEMKFSNVYDGNKSNGIEIPVNLGRVIKSSKILDFKKIIFKK